CHGAGTAWRSRTRSAGWRGSTPRARPPAPRRSETHRASRAPDLSDPLPCARVRATVPRYTGQEARRPPPPSRRRARAAARLLWSCSSALGPPRPPSAILFTSSRRELGDARGELVLRAQPDDRLDELSVPEEEQHRDRSHVVARDDLRILVDVQLRDLHASIELACEVFDDGAEHAAWAAPLGPEIDEGDPRLPFHLGGESRIRYLTDPTIMLYVAHRMLPPPNRIGNSISVYITTICGQKIHARYASVDRSIGCRERFALAPARFRPLGSVSLRVASASRSLPLASARPSSSFRRHLCAALVPDAEPAPELQRVLREHVLTETIEGELPFPPRLDESSTS